jgi:hypothetical protein
MFNAQQEQLREADPVKIVRSFVCSAFVYGADSKQRTPNPDLHPPISQREDGKYCDVEGRPIPLAKVPKYIIEQGQPPEATTHRPKQIPLADAMQDALTPADPTHTPAPARKTAAKRGRKVGAS